MPRKATATSSRGKRPTVKEMVKNLEGSGLKVQLVGRVRNGQLQIDQASLDEMSRKFPNANMTFVAVNAPFDPVSRASD